MARRPIKSAPKRRDLPTKAVATVKRRIAGTSDPAEGRVSDTVKSERYAQHMMSLNKQRDPKERCSVWIPTLVNRQRAEEWARYWQPRLGVPIILVVEGTLDRININNGGIDDPFPERPISYPWATEMKEILDRGRVSWANDATFKHYSANQEPDVETPAAVAPQADAGLVRRRVVAPVPAPRSRRESAAATVSDEPPGRVVFDPKQAKGPPPRRMTEAQRSEQGKRDSAAIRGNAVERPVGSGVSRPLAGTKAWFIVDACRARDGAGDAELKKANGGKSVAKSYIEKLARIAKLRLHVLGAGPNTRYRLT